MKLRVLLLCAGLLAAGAVRADCLAIHAQARDAGLAELEALYAQALQEPSCDDVFVDRLGLRIARQHTRAVQQQLRADPRAPVESALRHALRYGRPWQALAMLGDLRHAAGDYYQAATHFQEALTVLDQRAEGRGPPEQVIASIFRKAERDRLLAERYVPTPVDRSTGRPGGLGAAMIRGVAVRQVAVPITFEFDSTAFTGKGRHAAEDLLRILDSEGQPPIRLIGHTDERGPAAYNQDLSRRRAAAVRDYLREHGYGGMIAIEGRGERKPYRVDDPHNYTQEQRWQMDRRVELVRRP